MINWPYSFKRPFDFFWRKRLSDAMIALDAASAATSPTEDDALGTVKVARAVLEVPAAGIASGETVLFGPPLPDNAVITNAWYEVLLIFQSATDAATIGMGHQDDVVGIAAQLAISSGGNPYDAGFRNGLPDPSDAATYMTKTTAVDKRFQARFLGGETVTQGKLILFAEYSITE